MKTAAQKNRVALNSRDGTETLVFGRDAPSERTQPRFLQLLPGWEGCPAVLEVTPGMSALQPSLSVSPTTSCTQQMLNEGAGLNALVPPLSPQPRHAHLHPGHGMLSISDAFTCFCLTLGRILPMSLPSPLPLQCYRKENNTVGT